MIFFRKSRNAQPPRSIANEWTQIEEWADVEAMLRPLSNGVHGFGTSDIVPAVGVMRGQDVLARLGDHLPQDPVGHQRFDVALRREPDNQADPNAVAVYLADRHLGYLPRDEAITRHELADEAESLGLVLLGDAMLVGGGPGRSWGLRIQIKPHLRNKRGDIVLVDGTRMKPS